MNKRNTLAYMMAAFIFILALCQIGRTANALLNDDLFTGPPVIESSSADAPDKNISASAHNFANQKLPPDSVVVK